MSKLVQNKINEKPALTIKDTDFLLKLIIKSTFEGHELEGAYNVMQKLSKMHKDKLES